jgi:hypothetical protein
MLSAAVKTELRGELARLQARREAFLARIDAKIAGIRALLADEEEPAEAEDPPRVLVDMSLGFRLRAGEGFRPAIRRFVQEHPEVTNRQIIDALAHAGYRVTGRLPLNARVQLETRRMVASGHLRRDSEGRLSMSK